MAVNKSRTFSAVLAEVSKNKRPVSLAYASASAVVMARLSGCSATKSDLFPAKAIMIFSFACLCSSLTHAFALSSEDFGSLAGALPHFEGSYRLSNIVDHHSTICVPIIHRSKGLVSFLPCCVPYFKFYRGCIVERDGLCEKSRSDSRFPVVIKLILEKGQSPTRRAAQGQNSSPLRISTPTNSEAGVSNISLCKCSGGRIWDAYFAHG